MRNSYVYLGLTPPFKRSWIRPCMSMNINGSCVTRKSCGQGLITKEHITRVVSIYKMTCFIMLNAHHYLIPLTVLMIIHILYINQIFIIYHVWEAEGKEASVSSSFSLYKLILKIYGLHTSPRYDQLPESLYMHVNTYP